MFQTLVDSIVQVTIFSLIPFLWWLLFWRKKMNFFHWLGFKKPIIYNKLRFVILFVVTVCLLIIPGVFIIPLFANVDVIATNQFYKKGINALFPALIYAFIQTGLSEEILFRSFLMKRLNNKFGFQLGNVLQSLVFGLMHGVLFFSNIAILAVCFIVIFTAIVGWLLGWINENEAKGSIIPSWIMHGIVNFLSAIYVSFFV